MTKNIAMKVSAFGGAVVAGAAGGLALGPVGVAIGVLGGVLVGLPALYHDAPARRPKPDKRGQIADAEEPKS